MCVALIGLLTLDISGFKVFIGDFMNARAQIEELTEVTFLREEIPSTLNISMLSNVTNNQLINLKAKVVHLSGVKKIITRDGMKSKADCCLLHPSGSI